MLAFADQIIRRDIVISVDTANRRLLVRLVLVIIVFGGAYGATMGSFAAGGPIRPLQMLYSAIKVPLLLSATFLISVPSFFVLGNLLGLRDDFKAAICSIFMAQAGLAIVLASLSPFTVFWYLSSRNYNGAIVFNALMFALASFAAQYLIRWYFRPLIAKSPQHRWMMWGWIAVYSLVGIQMAWIMRPYIGSPDQPVEFFRQQAISNAYVAFARILWLALGGGS